MSHPHQLLPLELLELLKAEYSSCDYTNKDKHEEHAHWRATRHCIFYEGECDLDTLDIASSHLAVRLLVSPMNMSKA